MRKLILFIFLLLSGFSISSYGQVTDAVTRTDTVSRSLTTTFSTVTLDAGAKTIEIWNKTTGTIEYSYGTGSNGTRDTVNVTNISSGNIRKQSPVYSKNLYIRSTVAGTVRIIVSYGIYTTNITEHTDISGLNLTSTIGLPDTAAIWVSDTVTHTQDTLSRKYGYGAITNLLSIAPNRYGFTVTADSTIEVSYTSAFTAGTFFEVRAGATVESWTISNFLKSEIYIRKKSSSAGVCTYRIDFRGR